MLTSIRNIKKVFFDVIMIIIFVSIIIIMKNAITIRRMKVFIIVVLSICFSGKGRLRPLKVENLLLVKLKCFSNNA